VAADLVSLTEFDTWLGGAVTAENTLRTTMLEQVEAMFERACGRTHIPFQAAQTTRVEVRDGTGSSVIHLDYAISTLTSVVLGYDPAEPDETLVVADLLYAAGSRRLVRTDGVFGGFGAPRYVHVTYAAQADLPTDAAMAVLRVATAIYRQRGSEGVFSESVGGQFQQLAKLPKDDPVWEMAVAAHARAL